MKYIDADKLIATLERQNVDKKVIQPLIRIITSLQQEQPKRPDFDDVDPKHLVHSHYTKVRETKTGRVFWAEYSSEAAEWQKEQMLKDAYVESQIVEDGRIELEGDPLPCLNPIILLPYPQFKPGDKVRIIVLKEEE